MSLFIYIQNIKSFHFLQYSIKSHFHLISSPRLEAFFFAHSLYAAFSKVNIFKVEWLAENL